MMPCTIYIIGCGPAKFEVASSNRFGRNVLSRKTVCDLDLGVKVRQDVAKYPLHGVTYALVKLEVATSNSLGGDAFIRKYSVDL